MKCWIKYRISDDVVLERSLEDNLSAGAGQNVKECYSPLIYHMPIEDVKHDATHPIGFVVINEQKKEE